MYLRQHTNRWIAAAPAKLNLTLEVRRRRDDGFHDIETLITPISLFDRLVLEPLPADSTPRFELLVIDRRADRVHGSGESDIPVDQSNLIVRSLELLAKRAGVDLGARVILTKRIPSQAGLGGGSSNAAAALKLASAAWRLNWPDHKLAALSAELGSDIPFFFAGGAAVCAGRGEIVSPVSLPLGVPVVVVKPLAGLSTAKVFDQWRENQQRCKSDWKQAASMMRRGDFARLPTVLSNGLQMAACAVCEVVDECLQLLRSLPIAVAQMSGSGTACFAICYNRRQARQLASFLNGRRCGAAYALATCP